jgi:hypothetical protein
MDEFACLIFFRLSLTLDAIQEHERRAQRDVVLIIGAECCVENSSFINATVFFMEKKKSGVINKT